MQNNLSLIVVLENSVCVCVQGLLDNTDITFLQECAKKKKIMETTTVMISLQIFGKVFNWIAKQKCSVAD